MILVRMLLIVVIAIGTYLTLDVAYASASATEIVASPIPQDSIAGASTSADELPKFDEDLSKSIDDALSGTRGTYAVVIKDLKTGAVYTRNKDKVYPTASLYKLWVMAETYKQIEEGKFTEEASMSASVEALNKSFGISSESAELKEGGFSMSVKEALNRMITISHNYAAYMLTQKIKTSNMKSFLEENGFSHSKVGPDPESTAEDMALFMEKLYKRELGSEEHTKAMLDMLARQQLNDRIPKYLPKGTTVMHKTGELERVKHDVGIVSGPRGDYIIVLMSDSSDQLAAAERLANISKNVYDYMQKRE